MISSSSSVRSLCCPKTSIISGKLLPSLLVTNVINVSNGTSSRACVSMSSLPVSKSTASSIAAPLVRDNGSALNFFPQAPQVEIDESSRIMELVEATRRTLRNESSDSTEKMRLIDSLQRLGLNHHFEQDIKEMLQDFANEHKNTNQDLFTTSLRFRLLRHNGFNVTPDVFNKFTEENGKFKESLGEDTIGILSLYEASYLGGKGEEILSEAMKFSESKLRESSGHVAPHIRRQIFQSLELPRHLRMARLESRRYIEEDYSNEIGADSSLLELAKLDFNSVQALHQMELTEISRWWKQLGLSDKLPFARDRPLECFLWTVGLLPEPKYSGCRIELAKTIAVLLVIDDIFDTYGSYDQLILFTNAIRRWDLDAMDELPEYMKICYMALYNTTNEICYKVLKENGWSVLPYLKRTWIDMVEGFMLEAKWLNSGEQPNLEAYIENGVTTAGSYMALVHLFFLIGDGVNDENVKLLLDPYPKLFSSAGRILRLWDDLGTAKEEQERGDVSSSIQLYMKEKNVRSESEGRQGIVEIIYNLWKDMNGELIGSNALPQAIIETSFNMARTSQVVYQHEDDTYFSSVDNYVQSLFFTPVS
uniref:Sesquiterpene synthase 3 n=2 Tax=Valeriana officinalis TaxID=19953 RepID=L0HQE3_VALOF|nr:sesquiterpene synthase 3 [Valeriana officinalis]